jgi:hypothetical protein
MLLPRKAKLRTSLKLTNHRENIRQKVGVKKTSTAHTTIFSSTNQQQESKETTQSISKETKLSPHIFNAIESIACLDDLLYIVTETVTTSNQI